MTIIAASAAIMAMYQRVIGQMLKPGGLTMTAKGLLSLVPTATNAGLGKDRKVAVAPVLASPLRSPVAPYVAQFK